MLWRWTLWQTSFGGAEDAKPEDTKSKEAKSEETKPEVVKQEGVKFEKAHTIPEEKLVGAKPEEAQAEHVKSEDASVNGKNEHASSSPESKLASPPSETVKPEQPAPQVEPAPAARTPAESAVAPKKKHATTDNDRDLIALALNPTLEIELLRLSKQLLVRFWRIFKIRIPEMRIHYGMENPAQTGWLMGGLWTAQAIFPKISRYEFVPVWHQSGLAAYQGEVRITITLLRILRFFLNSLASLARFVWLVWRAYRQYKKDPHQRALAGWRRWILNQLAPLISEVAHDQA